MFTIKFLFLLSLYTKFKSFQQFFSRSNQPSLIKVRLGEWNLAGFLKPFPPMEFNITDIVIHSYFNTITLEYNLAMLYFATFAQLGQYPNIGTACLPKDDLAYSGIYCMVC